jgi:hypothetical protein
MADYSTPARAEEGYRPHQAWASEDDVGSFAVDISQPRERLQSMHQVEMLGVLLDRGSRLKGGGGGEEALVF